MPKGKIKKIIGLVKDGLGGRIMTKFVGLRAKTYSYLIDDGSEDKKAKGTKKCTIKRKNSKDLKVKAIIFLLKKLTRLFKVLMMVIKECNQLIQWKNMHTE